MAVKWDDRLYFGAANDRRGRDGRQVRRSDGWGVVKPGEGYKKPGRWEEGWGRSGDVRSDEQEWGVRTDGEEWGVGDEMGKQEHWKDGGGVERRMDGKE